MAPTPDLSPVCGQSVARLGGWQRKADAVSMSRDREFSLPSSTNALHPGPLPGEISWRRSWASLSPYPFGSNSQCFVKAVVLNWSCEQACIWLAPASWCCHLQLKQWGTEAPVSHLADLHKPVLLLRPRDQPGWSCLSPAHAV